MGYYRTDSETGLRIGWLVWFKGGNFRNLLGNLIGAWVWYWDFGLIGFPGISNRKFPIGFFHSWERTEGEKRLTFLGTLLEKTLIGTRKLWGFPIGYFIRNWLKAKLNGVFNFIGGRRKEGTFFPRC